MSIENYSPEQVMQRFSPNTVIQNRFLLKEELSFDQQAGQQVWAVQDQQTGQPLIARLHADGRVEWFSDNRPPVATPRPVAPVVIAPVTAAPLVQPAPPIAAAPTVTMATTALPAAGNKKRPGWFLAIVLVLGVAAGGYVYRKPLLAYAQSATAANPTDAVNSRVPAQQELAAASVETASDPAVAAGRPLAASPVTALQAARMLDVLETIPAVKHPAIFANARLAFATLRQTPGREQYADRLYTMYLSKGAQSFRQHQQNGDLVARNYALEWYKTAYALKPTSDLLGRLSQLTTAQTPTRNNKPTRLDRPTRKSPAPSPLFTVDPELNH